MPGAQSDTRRQSARTAGGALFLTRSASGGRSLSLTQLAAAHHDCTLESARGRNRDEHSDDSGRTARLLPLILLAPAEPGPPVAPLLAHLPQGSLCGILQQRAHPPLAQHPDSPAMRRAVESAQSCDRQCELVPRRGEDRVDVGKDRLLLGRSTGSIKSQRRALRHGREG